MSEPRSIVVLTGAGISRESGLHTFRDADGIWATVKVEDVATPEAFRRDPARVHAFYNARRRGLLGDSVAPNAAHLALAAFEARWPGPFLLVTQNIDDLHERAGSRELVHMHGELLRALCQRCGNVMPWREDLSVDLACPACAEIGFLRPHVVWFGEMPLETERICAALERCDLFVSIGTSGNVYPAAGFVQAAQAAGARTVELNLEPSEGASHFDEAVYGTAGTVVPEWFGRLAERAGGGPRGRRWRGRRAGRGRRSRASPPRRAPAASAPRTCRSARGRCSASRRRRGY